MHGGSRGCESRAPRTQHQKAWSRLDADENHVGLEGDYRWNATGLRTARSNASAPPLYAAPRFRLRDHSAAHVCQASHLRRRPMLSTPSAGLRAPNMGALQEAA